MQISSFISPAHARFISGKYAIRTPLQLLSNIERGDQSTLQLAVDASRMAEAYPENPIFPQAGDVIAVLPENSQEHISSLQKYLNACEHDTFFLSGRYESDEGRFYRELDALTFVCLNPIRLETLVRLKEKVQQMSEIPAFISRSVRILDRLLRIHAQAPDRCKQILQHCHLTDLLGAFPSLLTLQDICDTQKGNYRRVYTISGISRDSRGIAQTIQFLLALGVHYQVPKEGFNPGTTYEGTASGYLRRLIESSTSSDPQVECFVQPRSFGPPEKNSLHIPEQFPPKVDAAFFNKLRMPLLLLANGSGISGIRAVLEERSYWKQQGYSIGSSSLLFGIRNRRQDYIYQQDLLEYQKQGIIDRIVLAESRPSKGLKQYVQHVLMTGAFNHELKAFFEARSVIIICGDRRMGQMIVDGCLPILLPQISPERLPDQLRHTEFIHPKKFEWAKKEIADLKAQSLLIRSTSGSRYIKKKNLSLDMILEGLNLLHPSI
ncbi:MAG: hypothetical protein AAF587_19210 [Bacteroidota bacterium]